MTCIPNFKPLAFCHPCKKIYFTIIPLLRYKKDCVLWIGSFFYYIMYIPNIKTMVADSISYKVLTSFEQIINFCLVIYKVLTLAPRWCKAAICKFIIQDWVIITLLIKLCIKLKSDKLGIALNVPVPIRPLM